MRAHLPATIFPETPDGLRAKGTGIEFRMPLVDIAIAILKAFLYCDFSSERLGMGRRAVLVDPDGHKVKLLEGDASGG